MDSIISLEGWGRVYLIPNAFVTYLYHFHVDRDYFECHEVLEEYWKEETTQQKDSIWVGFILLAVANYHHRRNNFRGAMRTLEKAEAILHSQKKKIKELGLDINELFLLLEQHLITLKNNDPYQSYILPIHNPILLNQCLAYRNESNLTWGRESDLSNNDLIHRHKLRDRSSIIKERQNALNQRNQKDSE